MEAEFLNIFQAVIHVKIRIGLALIQIEGLECGPRPELGG